MDLMEPFGKTAISHLLFYNRKKLPLNKRLLNLFKKRGGKQMITPSY
jgi:hypothetical protein